jgi:hypothetical protein
MDGAQRDRLSKISKQMLGLKLNTRKLFKQSKEDYLDLFKASGKQSLLLSL